MPNLIFRIQPSDNQLMTSVYLTVRPAPLSSCRRRRRRRRRRRDDPTAYFILPTDRMSEHDTICPEPNSPPFSFVCVCAAAGLVQRYLC